MFSEFVFLFPFFAFSLFLSRESGKVDVDKMLFGGNGGFGLFFSSFLGVHLIAFDFFVSLAGWLTGRLMSGWVSKGLRGYD